MLKHANGVSEQRAHSMYCAQSSEWGLFGRNTRSAFRRTPSPPIFCEYRSTNDHINNTRAHGCACVDYPPKFGRRLCEEILCICSQIPPKLSNMIMSSSTPNEWSRSSTVFASSECACRIDCRSAALGDRDSSSSHKLEICGSPV